VTHTYIQAIKQPTLGHLTRSPPPGGYVLTRKPPKSVLASMFPIIRGDRCHPRFSWCTVEPPNYYIGG